MPSPPIVERPLEDAWDVVVVGAGPAGLAAATACAERGLRVLLGDPDPDRAWVPTLSAWVHEVPLPASCFHRTWARPLVYTDGGGPQPLDRAYGELDNRAVQDHLRQRLEAASGRIARFTCTGLAPAAHSLHVQRASGPPLAARVVVDATGSARRLLTEASPASGASVAWQTAYGIRARVAGHPWAADEMALMDFRSVPGTSPGPASFLYAMPRADHVLLEETVLAAVPVVPVEALARRLEQRLRVLGVDVLEVLEVERVRIPMNAPLPAMPQALPVVGFGAAAGFVHPATGYSVARSLGSAPALADALARGLDRGGPARAARLAWKAIHPPALRRAQQLARGGLQVLLGLEGPDLGRFMRAFFAMPTRHWTAFLSGMSPPCAVGHAMMALGRELPTDLLWRVSRLALTPRGRAPLLKGLLPHVG